MADLGPKKIGGNYKYLLQISESGEIADGTGSAFAVRLSGSSNVGIGSNPMDGVDLFTAGTISCSIISASTGVFEPSTLKIGNHSLYEDGGKFIIKSGSKKSLEISVDSIKIGNQLIKEEGGKLLLKSGSKKSMEIKGDGEAEMTYLILSASGADSGRPLLTLADDFQNYTTIDKASIKFLVGEDIQGWRVGAYPSASLSHEPGDFVINSSFLVYPTKRPPFFISSSDDNQIGIRTFGNLTNQLSVSGSIYTEGPEGHITASGNISASGTIYANDFQSSVGGTGIDFNDHLHIKGAITMSGDLFLSSSGIKDPAIVTSDNIIIGHGNYVSGANKSITIGHDIANTDMVAPGDGGIAIGFNITASGNNHIVIGDYATSDSYWIGDDWGSIAFGWYAQTRGNNAIAIGTKASASSNYDIAIGANSSASGSLTEPALAIGQNAHVTWPNSGLINLSGGSATVSDSNTFSIYGASKVGINKLNPSVALEVYGSISASGDFYSGGNKLVRSSQTGSFLTNSDTGSMGDLTVAGDISAGGTGSFGRAEVNYISASKGVFTNLPTSDSGVPHGTLYTLSGSQLPFSGSITEMNNISASKFVLVK